MRALLDADHAPAGERRRDPAQHRRIVEEAVQADERRRAVAGFAHAQRVPRSIFVLLSFTFTPARRVQRGGTGSFAKEQVQNRPRGRMRHAEPAATSPGRGDAAADNPVGDELQDVVDVHRLAADRERQAKGVQTR